MMDVDDVVERHRVLPVRGARVVGHRAARRVRRHELLRGRGRVRHALDTGTPSIYRYGDRTYGIMFGI